MKELPASAPTSDLAPTSPPASLPLAKPRRGRPENLKPIRTREQARALGRKGAAARLARFRLRSERLELALSLAGSSDLAKQHGASLAVLLQSIDAALIAEANLAPLRPSRIQALASAADQIAKLLGIAPAGRPSRTEQAPPAALAPRLVTEPGPAHPAAAASSAGPAAAPAPPAAARLDERQSAPLD